MKRPGTFDYFQIVCANEAFVGEIYQQAVRLEKISSDNRLSDFGDNKASGILL